MGNSKHLYTDIPTASIEIHNRWNDSTLREEVESYVREMPECFTRQPKAVLFRNIITPDHEFEQFIAQSKKINLAPLAIEYTKDKFSTRNDDKICLLKLAIFEKRNSRNEAMFYYKKIANLQENDNKKFSDITTENGEYLTFFHHRLLEKHATASFERYDLSTWIEKNGSQAQEYYKKIFALFLCHGVLFESFVTNDDEAVFENEVILPAFDTIEKTFGMKPLVAPLLPCTSDRYWWCYPPNILESC